MGCGFRVGKPRIRLKFTANKSVANGGVIPFDAIDYAESWAHVASSPTLIVPRTGFYLVTFSAGPLGTALPSFKLIGLRWSGGASLVQSRQSTTTEPTRNNGAALLECTLGDTIDLTFATDNVTNVTFGAATTSLAVARIGPERWT